MKNSSLWIGGAILTALAMPVATAPVLAAPAPTFTSKTDKYAIYLPGKPQSASRSAALPNGSQIKVNFVSLAKPPISYIVIPMKLPAAPTGVGIEQFLTGVERGFTMSTAAKLLSSKKLRLNGAAGREILVQVGPNLMRGRFFVKGNRSYQVIAVSPKNSEAKYRGSITQVLDSFRILN